MFDQPITVGRRMPNQCRPDSATGTFNRLRLAVTVGLRQAGRDSRKPMPPICHTCVDLRERIFDTAVVPISVPPNFQSVLAVKIGEAFTLIDLMAVAPSSVVVVPLAV